MTTLYRLKYRDRKGRETILAGGYETRSRANDQCARIAKAQLDLGASSVNIQSGCCRAFWPNGDYIEVWRMGQVAR